MTGNDAEEAAISAVLTTGIPVEPGVIAEVIRSVPSQLLVDLAVERGRLRDVTIGVDQIGELFVYGSGETVKPDDFYLWVSDDDEENAP